MINSTHLTRRIRSLTADSSIGERSRVGVRCSSCSLIRSVARGERGYEHYSTVQVRLSKQCMSPSTCTVQNCCISTVASYSSYITTVASREFIALFTCTTEYRTLSLSLRVLRSLDSLLQQRLSRDRAARCPIDDKIISSYKYIIIARSITASKDCISRLIFCGNECFRRAFLISHLRPVYDQLIEHGRLSSIEYCAGGHYFGTFNVRRFVR